MVRLGVQIISRDTTLNVARGAQGAILRRHTNIERGNIMSISKLFTSLLVLVSFSFLTLAYALPAIDQWERDNGYPYGKICEVYNTCK